MLRAFAAFLVVFSMLSLVVELNGLSTVFGILAVLVFAIDALSMRFARNPRPARYPEELVL